MAVKPRKHAASSLSITPLIDVVFLLLIFFLVSTKFAEEERSIEIDLPSASEALPLTAEPREMFININNDGRYFVEGQFRRIEELDSLLRQASANNPTTQTVVIRADKKVEHQFVMNVYDLCKKHQIYEYIIMTDE